MGYRLVTVLLLAVCSVAMATPAKAQQMSPPKKIKNVDPVYPAAAQQARVHGDVVIEATVGIDGKVTGARIIASIPLLDEPALAAVRQWEYMPAVMSGEPVAVTMKVTVHFGLEESPRAAPAAGPPVLDRTGEDWTVNGTPLLDADLRFWLHDVMRTAPAKDLVIRGSAIHTYGELVEVLASATAAGVDQLFVSVGTDDSKQNVRVWLDPAAQRVPGVILPVSEVASQVKSTAVPLVLAKTGGTVAAKTAVQRVVPGSIVRLRIDRSRTLSDVWEILKLGTSRQLEGFALGVQLPPGAAAAANAPVSPKQQQEWDNVSASVKALILSEQKTLDQSIGESVPILEKFVARNPNVFEAQFKLASAYQGRATRPQATADARRHDRENAVRHFALAAASSPSEEGRFLSTWEIARLYEPDALNDTTRAERYARRLVDEFPGQAVSHTYYARTLHDAGDLGGAVNALRHGRTVSSMPMSGLAQSTQYLMEYVQAKRDLPRESARPLLQELTALSDAMLANPERQDADSRLAVMARVLSLEIQAERLAETSAERVPLLAEADRWSASLTEGTLGKPAAPARLSQSQAEELECRAFGRWSNLAVDSQPIATSIGLLQRYVRAKPACDTPHRLLASVLMRRATGTADPSAQTADRLQAVEELLQLIDLSASTLDRIDAFTQLAELAAAKTVNRPERVDAAARLLVKRAPEDPAAHYAVALVLFASGRAADGEKALRTARTSIKATPSTRAAMARELVRTIRYHADLPPAAARRLFDEAGALVTEAEKSKGGKDDRSVVAARSAWLNLSADQFETDPARAAAQRDLAKQLADRVREIK